MVDYYVHPSTPEVRLQQRRAKFLITKIVNKVSDDLEESSTGGLNSAVMIESEEKGKQARKQKRIEEHDRREYVVYTFDEHQGFYRNPPIVREQNLSNDTSNPLTLSTSEGPVEDPVTLTINNIESSEHGLSMPENAILHEEFDDLEDSKDREIQSIPQQQLRFLPHSSSAISKSQSLKAPRGAAGTAGVAGGLQQRKFPTRSTSLKDFRNQKTNGEGRRIATGGVMYLEDAHGGGVKFSQNTFHIQSYDEQEKHDEERMMAEDSSVMYVADE